MLVGGLVVVVVVVAGVHCGRAIGNWDQRVLTPVPEVVVVQVDDFAFRMVFYR